MVALMEVAHTRLDSNQERRNLPGKGLIPDNYRRHYGIVLKSASFLSPPFNSKKLFMITSAVKAIKQKDNNIIANCWGCQWHKMYQNKSMGKFSSWINVVFKSLLMVLPRFVHKYTLRNSSKTTARPYRIVPLAN